ncbi:hypothetical protein V6N13_052425 [Hibiscus sabdariffa]|uniref:Glutathione transferase n=1 Tax=Hibiscus sabdariffa TaxID=183260 RepID=A0ABR2Q4B1_9ROSI
MEEVILGKELGYVVMVVVLYCFLVMRMASRVGKARMRYKVFYPTLYALESENKDAKLFNCIQRAHQHSLEVMPMFLVLLILGGMAHPRASSALGLVYVISRYFFFTGYATGDPDNRLRFGRFGVWAMTGLFICTISFGIDLLLS